MAHNTLNGGAVTEIGGGKAMFSGTVYEVDSGKALSGGTVYPISFDDGVCTVNIDLNLEHTTSGDGGQRYFNNFSISVWDADGNIINGYGYYVTEGNNHTTHYPEVLVASTVEGPVKVGTSFDVPKGSKLEFFLLGNTKMNSITHIYMNGVLLMDTFNASTSPGTTVEVCEIIGDVTIKYDGAECDQMASLGDNYYGQHIRITMEG